MLDTRRRTGRSDRRGAGAAGGDRPDDAPGFDSSTTWGTSWHYYIPNKALFDVKLIKNFQSIGQSSSEAIFYSFQKADSNGNV